MFRIGLLISNLSDDDICEFVQGAARAAKDLEISLTIIPGGMFPSKEDTKRPHYYAYQQNAAFDYIQPDNFEGIILDAESICVKVPKEQKEKFVSYFVDNEIPTLLIDKIEEIKCFSIRENILYSNRQKGYQAILDIISIVKTRKMADKSAPEDETILPPSIDGIDAMFQLKKMCEYMLHRIDQDENPYEYFLKVDALGGMKDAVVLAFGEPQENTIDNPWKIPEMILVKGLLMDGEIIDLKKEGGTPLVQTSNVMKDSNLVKVVPGVYIGRVMYHEEKQLGMYVARINDGYLLPHFEQLSYEILESSIMSIVNRKIINAFSEDILSLQEELKKDDDILDRIGDRDFMTGEFNRRGFFTKAYELLGKKYAKGTRAVVGYVKLDTLKEINDKYGRDEGNVVVRKAATALHEMFNEKAIIGRIRGNEFALFKIAYDEKSEEDIRVRLMQLNGDMQASNEKPYKIHLLFAVASYKQEENLDFSQMLSLTDGKLKGLESR